MEKSQCKFSSLNSFVFVFFRVLESAQIALYNTTAFHHQNIGGSIGGSVTVVIFKIKESNKTKQKIEDNPLKRKERKSCIFVYFSLCVHALIRVKTNIFPSKFSFSTPLPPLKNLWIRACHLSFLDGRTDEQGK